MCSFCGDFGHQAQPSFNLGVMFRHVDCESDSLNAIGMSDAPPLMLHLRVLLMDIVDIYTRMCRVSLHHIS